ncbi:guanylate cyclase [Williamsia soli]|uniref:guanylate cyclase n=1 Tax=Williamsia soli TaxID=364929 RepID=UPI001A9F6FBB|nr:guanylate cyclase [Williamsia soli]
MSLEQALDQARTGDIWLFRGRSGPDRAIQTLTNSPVNHVAMTVAIDDLPPLMWHAELGNKLTDMWTGTNHRGVQLNDAREAALQWMEKYGQRCWLRQLTPYAQREQEDLLLKVIAKMDGTAFPTTARLAGRWFRGRVPTANDVTRGIPVLDKKVRQTVEKRNQKKHNAGLETAYCAEVVAMTYEHMGLLATEKHANWFDPGKFWSGDTLPLAPGYALGTEIAVELR